VRGIIMSNANKGGLWGVAFTVFIVSCYFSAAAIGWRAAADQTWWPFAVYLGSAVLGAAFWVGRKIW